MKSLKNKNGISFTEMMVSTLLLTVIIGGLLTTFIVGNSSWQRYDLAVQTQQQVRQVISTMSRDLRVSNQLSFTQNTANDVVFTFNHPDDGSVTYSWTDDVNDPDVNRIVRTTSSASRIIALDISGLVVTDNRPTTQDVNINVQSTVTIGTSELTDSFQLTKKVATR